MDFDLARLRQMTPADFFKSERDLIPAIELSRLRDGRYIGNYTTKGTHILNTNIPFYIIPDLQAVAAFMDEAIARDQEMAERRRHLRSAAKKSIEPLDFSSLDLKL